MLDSYFNLWSWQVCCHHPPSTYLPFLPIPSHLTLHQIITAWLRPPLVSQVSIPIKTNKRSNLTNKSNLIDRLWYDFFLIWQWLAFFGHPVGYIWAGRLKDRHDRTPPHMSKMCTEDVCFICVCFCAMVVTRQQWDIQFSLALKLQMSVAPCRFCYAVPETWITLFYFAFVDDYKNFCLK